ncbi:unnamed protein product [Dicrocoelium dendriticum]|nr:unnamed protein product [Dicrocoelium dendriticum]
MKLYANTPQVLLGLCNSDIPEVSDTMLKLPCQFTLEEDSDCSLLMNQIEMTKTNYTVDCFASRSKRSNNVYREIVLNITHLRSDVFDGYVFCETIVQSQRYKDYETGENAYKRLTSEVAHLRLPLAPVIETLLFDPHEEVWKCIGSAHPEVKSYLGIIQVDSELENQVVDTYWHKVIPVVPAWRRLEQLPATYQFDMDDVIYQWELILVPRPPIWELAPETRLTVQCSFGNESANLTTLIPENVYSTHYRNAGGKLEFNCFFRDSTLDPIRQISINRLIQPGWLEYDLTLGTVIVAGWMEGNWRKLDESELEIRELQLTNAHLWRLHTDRDDRNLRMTIDTLHSTEFDSGEYYCTAVTAKNVYYNLAPIPAAVRGTQRGMLFAQRAPELSTRWSIKVPSAVVSKILQTRCLIWTTNIGYNPSLEFNRVPAEHERLLKRNVVFRNQSRMSIVKLMEDWFQVLRSDSSTEGDRIGCTVRDESGRESTKWLIMPSMECTAPESVYWEPFTYSDYRRSAKLQCRAKGGCVSPTLTWAWIAGPIRPSIAMKGWNTSKVSEGDMLHMSRLPGPGAYAFECVASCECSGYPFSTRIIVTFFVGESLVNYTLWKDEWQNATSDELFGGTYKNVEKDTQSDVDKSFTDIPNELRWKQLHRSQALDSWECHTGGLNEVYECGSEEADMLGKDGEAMDRSVGPDISKDRQHFEGGYSIDAVGSTRNAEAQLKNNPQVIRWNVLRRGPDARTTFLQGSLQLRTADELAPSIKKLRHTERTSYTFGEIAGKHSTRLEKANEYENRVVREYRIEDYLKQVVTREHSIPHVPSNVDPLPTFLEAWEEWDPWARVAENEFDSTKEFHVEVQRSVLEAEFAQQRKEVEPVHVDKPLHQRVYKRRTPSSAQNRIRSSVGHYLPTNHPVPPRRSTSIQWSWDPKMETDEVRQHYGYSQVILRHQKSLSEFSEHNVEGQQQRQMSRKLHTKNSAMTGDEQLNWRPAFWLDDTTFEPGHQMRSEQKEICSGSCNAKQEQHQAARHDSFRATLHSRS